MNHCHHRPTSLWNCKSIKSRGRTLRLLPFGYARLPKLEVRKFGGNIGEWEEFWESFESAINKNSTLSDVDKYSYLRGLLVELARSAIAGFALMSANYKAATELLKRRYGKKTTIQRTYINDLMNIEPIYMNEMHTGSEPCTTLLRPITGSWKHLVWMRKHTPPSWCLYCWRNFQNSFV